MTPDINRTEFRNGEDAGTEVASLGRKRLLTLVVAASLPGLVGANAAGTVDFVAGNVMVVYTDGNRETLSRGMSVSPGDTIRTGYRGLAQIRFTDGSFVSVQRNSAFRIDEYAYDPNPSGLEKVAQKVNKGLFSLLQGGFRTLTGLLGSENYSVKTPVATIGIRGTEYMAELGRSLTVHVGDGAIEICNEAGCHFFRTNEAGYVENQAALIRRLRDLGLDIVISTERGETIASLEGDEDFRFRIFEEVDDQGESILLDEEAVTATPRVDCASANCTAAFVWKQFTSVNFDKATQISALFNGDVMTGHDGGTGGYGPDSPGTTTAQGAGRDELLAWGRWVNGTTTAGLDHVHYVIGTPTPNINSLSGTHTFSVYGFTNPTVDNPGNTGAFNRVSGAFDANFDTSEVLVDFIVEFAQGNYVFSPLSVVSINSDSTFSGIPAVDGGNTGGLSAPLTCDSVGCNGFVTGFFAGGNADKAGLTYHIDDNAATFGAGDIFGAVVFQKD